MSWRSQTLQHSLWLWMCLEPWPRRVSVGAAGRRVPVWAVVAASIERSVVVGAGGAGAIAAIIALQPPVVSAFVLAVTAAAASILDGGGIVPAWHTAGSSWDSASLVGCAHMCVGVAAW